MSKAKAASPKPKGKGEAAAAVSEVDDSLQVEWEGLTLTKRKREELPGTYRLQLLELAENPGDVAVLSIIRTRLEPESYVEVYGKFTEVKDTEADELIGSLWRAVMGLDLGEASASEES